jgi:hypothetical protein
MEKSDQLRELFQMKTVLNERPDGKRNEANFKRLNSGCTEKKATGTQPV